MKTIKLVDFWLSVVLISVFGTLAVIKQDVEVLLLGYVVVGSWQVISMAVHVFTQTFTHSWGARSIYHWITLIALVTIPIGSFWILFFAAPFMALFYTWICYREVFIKMQRPLAVLK